MDSIILKCTCKNEYQDKLYGTGMRVHTVSQKDKNKKLAFCTVCTPNKQREKHTKTIEAKDNKAFGMTHTLEYHPRIGKSY